MTRSLPKTGQAVITDIGEAFDIHPKNKQEVGKRLAKAALQVAYGQPVLGEGPVYKSMKVEGEKVILTFGNVGDGLTTSDRNRYGYVNGFSMPELIENLYGQRLTSMGIKSLFSVRKYRIR